MSAAAIPTSADRIPVPPKGIPALPAAPYEGTWIGYEAALPWIRISPPLLARAVSRPR